ncbi:NYN domain-containing protein [Desulfosporosinus sp. FKB]|uniref:NYN domain-containing protein n=1 Tax=Desulfosporosinus sp. FKB TaxID=1969835 RepID=UPI000B49AF44|nr:NYN domain-containing protein [Desulfosporosinus sp. FKB]
MDIHIFWDNSNIWGNAMGTKQTLEPKVPDLALRIYFRNLNDLIMKGRNAASKCMAGSVPPECRQLWDYARQMGYNTDLLYRVDTGDGVQKEQAVDELLHLKISDALLDFEAPQTLIILTGDGKVSDYGTSFAKQVERALKRGWNVEIYAWEHGFNSKIYTQIQANYPSNLSIIHLDPYYYQLTFVAGGNYYDMDEQGQKSYFHVDNRIVKPL